MIFDGPQAAGKSTVAKAVFYFRSVKDDFLKLFLINNDISDAENFLMNKFRQMFGSCDNFSLSFQFDSDFKIDIVNNKINFNKKISVKDISDIQKIFNDDKEIIYIPAGRSMLSIFSHQLNYIFAVLDDNQKNMIDYCTRNYIERILKIKPLLNQIPFKKFYNPLVDSLIQKILQGSYKYIDGNEKLQLAQSDKNININFASSGQQDSLWILNLIYYYLANDKPTCFIIEEPESHLYPNTQKDIAEFIVCALTDKNDCIVTTHSPYILGALNNILDVRRLFDAGFQDEILKIVSRENIPLIDDCNEVSAYFIDDGKILNAIDEDTGLIQNELIDGASDKINQLADQLLMIERG